MPTTIAEHTVSLHKYSTDFARTFPDLPSLPCFIGMLSTSPVPVIKLLPNPSETTRQLWLNALVWLLKNDLVVQVHNRARIFASSEVKERAWRNLWHRRRKRWLQSKGTPEQSHSELVTPKAGDPVDNPLNQSYMSFDPDLEMDSDLGEDDGDVMEFSKEAEPESLPSFVASFVFKPAKAQKDEARWIRVIRETGDEVSASKFDL